MIFLGLAEVENQCRYVRVDDVAWGEGEGELCLYGNENGETWEIDISDELDKIFIEVES